MITLALVHLCPQHSVMIHIRSPCFSYVPKGTHDISSHWHGYVINDTRHTGLFINLVHLHCWGVSSLFLYIQCPNISVARQSAYLNFGVKQFLIHIYHFPNRSMARQNAYSNFSVEQIVVGIRLTMCMVTALSPVNTLVF